MDTGYQQMEEERKDKQIMELEQENERLREIIKNSGIDADEALTEMNRDTPELKPAVFNRAEAVYYSRASHQSRLYATRVICPGNHCELSEPEPGETIPEYSSAEEMQDAGWAPPWKFKGKEQPDWLCPACAREVPVEFQRHLDNV